MRLFFLTTAYVLTIGVLVAYGDAPKAAPATTDHHAMMEECAKACDDCARLCDMCAAHCAKMVAEGKKEHLKTLQTCADCASICSAASCVVARSGPFSDILCSGCADACKRCGDACEQFKDDPMMKRCMDECRKCEKACRDMMKHMAPAGRAAN